MKVKKKRPKICRQQTYKKNININLKCGKNVRNSFHEERLCFDWIIHVVTKRAKNVSLKLDLYTFTGKCV